MNTDEKNPESTQMLIGNDQRNLWDHLKMETSNNCLSSARVSTIRVKEFMKQRGSFQLLIKCTVLGDDVNITKRKTGIPSPQVSLPLLGESILFMLLIPRTQFQ